MIKPFYTTIPSSWAVAELGSLVNKIIGGGTPSRSNNAYYQGDIPWMTVKDMTSRRPGKISEHITLEAVANSSTNLIPPHTIIIATRMSLGKIVMLPFEVAINQDLKALIIPEYIDKNYVEHWFISRSGYLESLGTGTTVKGIRLEVLKRLRFPLPPLNEQKRIVTKIEALQTRSSAVKEELDAIKPLLNQFRQSVLAAAFRGDLTKDWREQNPDVEPASKLIASLQTPDPEHHLDIFKQSCYYKLPKSWIWVQLGKLGTLLGGGTPSKRNPGFWNGHIPWISAKDMKIDRIEDSIDHITEEAISKSSAKIIPKSSILFVVRGMILNHTLPIAITDDVVTINQDMKALVPEIADMSEYLLFACKFVSKQILFKVKSATHGTRRLETATLKDWAIPIPPISEQKEIVRRIESLFKLADSIEQQYQQAETNLETLNQSILAKAFRGELVPQDPNDEPASVLLEKIKEERDRAKATAKKSKTKKKSSKKKDKQLGIPGM